MANERTAAEAKAQDEARPVVVLQRCFTQIDHNPGEIVQWTGELPETGIMRELTEDEREEFEAKIAADRARSRQFGEAEQAAPHTVPVRSEQIMAALNRLNPENDNDWTESGQPAIAALNRELLIAGVKPDVTTRAEVRSIAPDFARPEKQPEGAASDTGGESMGMAPVEGGF